MPPPDMLGTKVIKIITKIIMFSGPVNGGANKGIKDNDFDDCGAMMTTLIHGYRRDLFEEFESVIDRDKGV